MAAADLRIRISADNQASAGLRGVQQSLRGLDQQARAVQNGLAGLGSTFKSFAAGYVGMQALQSLVRVNVETDKLKANLVTATGSVANAGRVWDDLAKFAAKTPFAIDEVVSAFVRLKNLGLDPSKEALTAYGNIASSMGKTMMQFAEAVADAVTGEFERLKEFGIKASKDGDRVTFIFRGQATEIGNNAREIEGYLRRLGEIEFAGAMDEQMKTLGASVDRLAESWENLLRKVGDSGYKAGLKRFQDDATGVLDWVGMQLDRLRNAELGMGAKLFTTPNEELAALSQAVVKATTEAKVALDELNAARKNLSDPTINIGSKATIKERFSGYETAAKETAARLLELEQRRAELIRQVNEDLRIRQQREQEIADASALVGPGWMAEPPKLEIKIDPKLDKVDPELAVSVTLLIQRAAEEGIRLGISSGFRDPKNPENWQRWYDAIKQYGSQAEARKHVAPPDTSMHGKNPAGAVDTNILGILSDEELRRQARRLGEIVKEMKLNLNAPVASETWNNPDGRLIHIQLLETEKDRQEALKKAEDERAKALREINAYQEEAARLYDQTRTPVEALGIALERINELRAKGYLQNEETYYRAVSQAQDDFTSGVERLQKDLEKTQGPAKAMEAAIIQMNLAYQAGRLSQDKYIEGVEEAQKRFEEAMRKMKEKGDELRPLADRLRDAGEQIGQSFGQAFENAVLGAGKFRDIMRGLLQDISRAILRATVTEPLGDFIGKFSKNVLFKLVGLEQGGIMSDQGPLALPRFAMGGIMGQGGSLPLQRYATGGIATRPQLALFGEGSMNEAYVPLPDGRSIPVSFRKPPETAAQPLQITVKNLPGQSASVQQDSQGGLTIEIVRAQLAADMQRGGVPWVTTLERRYGVTRGRG